MDNEKSKRIQVARGIAIIAVLVIHIMPRGILQVYVRPLANFSVGLFLFLSGLLTKKGKYSFKKRFWKIFIPYVIWTLIYAIWNCYYNLPYLPVYFLKRLALADIVAPMYYVFVYIEFTALIPLIDKLGSSKYKYLGFLISPLEIIFLRLIPRMMDISLGVVFQTIIDLSCFGWFSYFYLGYLIGNEYVKFKFSDLKLWIAYIIALGIQVFETWLYYVKSPEGCGTQMKVSAFLAGLIFCLIMYNYINNDKARVYKVLKIIGDCSFGIFFSHMAIIRVLDRVNIGLINNHFYIKVVVVLVIDTILVLVGKKVLGKYSKYLAL